MHRQSQINLIIRFFGISVVVMLSGIALLMGRHVLAAPATVTWPTITLTPYVSGLNNPTYLTHAGDNSGRLFVVEKPGRIRIVKNGTLLPTPFLDIASLVKSSGSEQGLLSVAFPPDHARQGVFYVYYTNQAGIGNAVVARYRVTANADVADPNSEQVLLTVPEPEVNHNGGQLQFGPDGFLYIGVGDGGGAGDRHGTTGNGQDGMALLGKILRIDVQTDAYRVPPTNPYTQTSGFRGEIWALGLRNPWRFSFDRLTGDLYIADVGQDQWEEVDYEPAASQGGENYGWRLLEGNHCYNPANGCVPPARYVAPVAEYSHGVASSTGCSITGGYVYRGADLPAMQGVYFYADYCSGRVWGLQKDGAAWVNQQLGQFSVNPSSFGEDQAGNLYLVGLGGVVYRISSQ